MSKKAAESHKKASEHLTHAAHHHTEAAKHHETGQHEKAAHHAMMKMGLAPIYQHPKTSEPHPRHKIYPADEHDGAQRTSRCVAGAAPSAVGHTRASPGTARR